MKEKNLYRAALLQDYLFAASVSRNEDSVLVISSEGENTYTKAEAEENYLNAVSGIRDRKKLQKEIDAAEGKTAILQEMKKGGDITYVEVTVLPDEEEILLLVKDASEQVRKQQEEEARVLSDEQKETQDNYLSRISHDIRTPISSILHLSEFVEKEKNDPAAVEKDIQKIHASTKELENIVTGLLDMQRVNTGRVELMEEQYSFYDYVSEIRRTMERMAAEKGISFHAAGRAASGVLAIEADRRRIDQITMNILNNALRYTRAGGSIFFRAATKTDEYGRAFLEFSVKDNGIGMSPQYMKRLYTQYLQDIDNPLRTQMTPGTGLSLAVSKKLIDIMKGTIDVESKMGKGTTVTVTIPVRPCEDQTLFEKKVEAAEDELLSGRVLMAEDNDINAEIASRIFQVLGVEAERAVNGQEAIRMFSQSAENYYSAVFMDIQMPLLNGLEASAAIRAMERSDAADIPIYAMTADSYEDSIQAAKEAGMNDCLTKPLDIPKIREILKQNL